MNISGRPDPENEFEPDNQQGLFNGRPSTKPLGFLDMNFATLDHEISGRSKKGEEDESVQIMIKAITAAPRDPDGQGKPGGLTPHLLGPERTSPPPSPERTPPSLSPERTNHSNSSPKAQNPTKKRKEPPQGQDTSPPTKLPKPAAGHFCKIKLPLAENQPLLALNWSIPNYVYEDLNLYKKYLSMRYTRCRTRTRAKRQKINPQDATDDSDDSIDLEQDAVRNGAGIRPRKNRRRDPDYPSEEDPELCPELFDYSSSDDDERKRKRARLAAESTNHSLAMRDANVRKMVIPSFTRVMAQTRTRKSSPPNEEFESNDSDEDDEGGNIGGLEELCDDLFEVEPKKKHRVNEEEEEQAEGEKGKQEEQRLKDAEVEQKRKGEELARKEAEAELEQARSEEEAELERARKEEAEQTSKDVELKKKQAEEKKELKKNKKKEKNKLEEKNKQDELEGQENKDAEEKENETEQGEKTTSPR